MAAHDFSGKRVLVTGGSQGIGEAIARGFAAAGADTIVLAETKAVVATAKRLSAETGTAVTPLVCDIADEAQVKATFADLGNLDILINNAGYQPHTPIVGCLPEATAAFRRVIDVNVIGTWLITQAALPHMGRGGRIILTSSIWGKTGAAEYSGYAASKHANIGFMRSLALELGPLGVTVNCVCPGWVETEGSMWSVREIAAREGRPTQALIGEYLQHQPLPGMMAPGDVVGTYLFLASEAARDITGQAINVDRGSFIG